MARIQEDPRIDQRLKAAFSAPPAAGLPNGQLQSLWSGDGLYERDYWLTSSPDSNQVALRFARPAGTTEPMPCVFYIHGGGMAAGSAYDARSIPRARMLAKLGCAVASIDFRNCQSPPSDAAEPGHGPGTTEIAPYPAGLNDCMSGLIWVHAHAAELGIDSTRVIVAGVSGGGNLTIAVALKAKQEGSLARLIPRGFYALCPYIAGTWPQDVVHGDFMLGDSHLDSGNNGIFLKLGGSTSGSASSRGYGQDAFDRRDPLAWPGFATVEDLTGLPRCVISVNECDPLRDEVRVYICIR